MEDQTNEKAMSDVNAGKEQAVASEKNEGSGVVNEEIMFQRIMDYRAYRRGMIMKRILITALVAFALLFTSRISIVFGIILPVIAIIIGAISILVSMGNERTYNIYNTRVVIKRRGDDTRKSVPLENIVSVKFKSAFYEKRLCIGTVTIRAKNAKGKIKKYKLKHIFDAKPVVEYLTGVIDGRSTNADKN